MPDYRYKKCAFWSDPYIQSLNPSEKLVFDNLFTNEHTTQAGIYSITTKTIAFETGVPLDEVERILEKFESDGKIAWDKENNIIWVKNFLKHQPNRSKKVLERIRKDLDTINTKNPELVIKFHEYYQDTILIPYRYPIWN